MLRDDRGAAARHFPCLAKTRCFLPLISLFRGPDVAGSASELAIMGEIQPLRKRRFPPGGLLDDLAHHAGADGAAALADREAQASSIATGLISSTAIFTLSPGITISTPSGRVTAPVMSVVRK